MSGSHPLVLNQGRNNVSVPSTIVETGCSYILLDFQVHLPFIIFIIFCGTFTGGSILGLPLLDPLAGLVVSGMILKAGIQTGYER
jgi:hypothetical protein